MALGGLFDPRVRPLEKNIENNEKKKKKNNKNSSGSNNQNNTITVR